MRTSFQQQAEPTTRGPESGRTSSHPNDLPRGNYVGEKKSLQPACDPDAAYKDPYGKLIAMTETRNTTKTRVGRRAIVDVPRREWFAVGKYRVLSEPLPGAIHMRRYSVFLENRRIGATVSLPSESDCLNLERPRSVPPLKPFNVPYRPGRPKKGTTRPAVAAVSAERGHTISREDLPPGAPIRESIDAEDG